MTHGQADLVQEKQRLTLESAALRAQFAEHAAGLAPVLGFADRVRGGVHWLAVHPEWVVGAVAAVITARPGSVWRWLRRGFFTWQAWRKLDKWNSDRIMALVQQWRRR